MRKMILFSVLTTFLSASSNVYCEDWPFWRGQGKNGISSDKGWNPSGINKKIWEKNVGAGYSAVSVVENKLYTMGNRDGHDIVVCIEADTGKEIWSFPYPCGKGGGYAGPRATPVVINGLVFTFSNEGDVHCLDAGTGKKKWKQNVSDLGAKNIKWKYSSSPCLVDGMIVVNAGKNGMAFDQKSGKVIWKSRGVGGYATPVAFELKNKKYLAVFSKNTLEIVSLKDGKNVASTPWQTKYDINASDPIIEGNKIFISSGYNNAGALFEFDGRSLKEIWKNKKLKCHFTTPVLLDGYLYGSDGQTGKGNLVCISFKDGKEKWRDKQSGYGSIIISDGKIIYLNDRGKLMIGKCSPSSFTPEVSEVVLRNAGKCWTMPVLVNKKLYCRGGNGKLICFDMK